VSRAERLALVAVVALGTLVRLLPVIGAAGPVGDGGLFYAMVEDIRAAELSLPTTTSYNALDIPFVYPPAGPMLAAAIGQVTGLATLDLMRWIPPVLSVLTLGAFAWLAWRLLPPVAAVGASAVYALMPHAYDWVIAGGGLTRGLGLLAMLVALALSARQERHGLREPILAGAALGVAALSHPQAAIVGVIGSVVLSWAPPFGAWMRSGAVAAATAFAIVLPWLAFVVLTFGVDAFFSAANRLEPLVGLIRLANLRFSGAPFMDVFAVLGAVGLLVAALRGPRRVTLLLVLVYLVGAGGGEFLAAVPWALLGGVGVASIVELATPRVPRAAVAAAGAVVLGMALIGSLGASADGSSKLHAVTARHIEAMRWLAANAPEDARVLVPTGGVWGDDEVSEWLPALAERHSIGTVQGSEWLGADGFEGLLRTHEAIRGCYGSTADCYAGIDADAWLFIPKGQLSGPLSSGDCCPALRSTLEAAGYDVVFDDRGATIARP
jgi:hypothetical protein